MRNSLILLFTTLLTACASVLMPLDYAGNDRGHVVVGIGADADTVYESYNFLFRRVGSGSEAQTGRFQWIQRNVFHAQKPDYKSDTESGYVAVASLPPGDYEVFNFEVWQRGFNYEARYSSKQPFSIRFSVRPGETTYLGNYAASGISGRNIIGLSVQAGAYFVLSSAVDRDVAIARSKEPKLSLKMSDQTPSPASVGNPYFRSTRVASQ
jgi:hypothetical protein